MSTNNDLTNKVKREEFLKHFTQDSVLATAQTFGSCIFKPTELARELLVQPASLLAGSITEYDRRAAWVTVFGSSVVCRLLDQLASQAKVLKKSRGEYQVRGVIAKEGK